MSELYRCIVYSEPNVRVLRTRECIRDQLKSRNYTFSKNVQILQQILEAERLRHTGAEARISMQDAPMTYLSNPQLSFNIVYLQ